MACVPQTTHSDPTQVVASAMQQMDALPPIYNSDSLQQAFQLFISMSDQLTDSYRLLENRVDELNGKLATVSEQRLEELAEKERLADRLSSLLALLPGGVVVLDQQGNIQEFNLAAQELLGLLHVGEAWIAIIDRVFAPQSDDGHEISLKDGRRVSVVTRSLDAEPGQIILITDQTQTRQLQQLVSRHERLSAMGNMVASLAHQIRTPLSAAMLYAEHLTKPTISRDKQVKFAEKILSRLTHLESQVRDMLLFVKGDLVLDDDVLLTELFLDINAAIEAVVEESNSQVIFNKPANGLVIHCNRDALISAICNIVNNAIQAVGKGAHITFNTKLTDKHVLAITIADKGPGMSEEMCKRVFEPFFTTKAQGTGLGLSVVAAVMRAHGGNFNFESSIGEGTKAILQLPYKQLVGDKV